MSDQIKVAIVGLDTSHSVALPKLAQDPEETKFHIDGLHFTRCLRFETPFQKKEGLDERQKYLESIGVQVTEDFDEAVADCDAIMIEINDPSLHLEYFKRCAGLGKPIFLDKPFADSLAATREILAEAKKNNARFFTASSLRFDVDFCEMLAKNPKTKFVNLWGALGNAAAGSSVIWYGVHTMEMLEQIMGPEAVSLKAQETANGSVICVVEYPDEKRAVVELTRNCWCYGGMVRDGENNDLTFHSTGRVPFYHELMVRVKAFFQGAGDGVPLKDSFEAMALLEAAQKSVDSGEVVKIEKM